MKKTIFNYRLIGILAFAVIFILLATFSIVGEDSSLAVFIGLIAFSLLPLFVFFISPVCYIFDSEKIKIHYFFEFYEIIYWKNIRDIERAPVTPSSCFMHNYHIAVRGGSIGKTSFFTLTEINKTKNIKKLIQQYWKSGFDE